MLRLVLIITINAGAGEEKPETSKEMHHENEKTGHGNQPIERNKTTSTQIEKYWSKWGQFICNET